MTTPPATDARGVDDLPDWVRRSWLIPLIIGIAFAILGLILLFNTNAGVATLRWLVVIALVFAAIEAFATASLRTRPWVGWLVGFIMLAGAVIGIVWPGITLLVLVITVGVSLLVGGVIHAVMAWQLKGSVTGWGWGFALGLLEIVAGLILLFGSPVNSVTYIAIVLAIYVFITGFTMIMLAFAVRRVTTAIAGGTVETPPV
jgi:uncharacterized membrane protein HdeD (DUF308 family)